MPIYEYACPECRVIFSFLAKSASSKKKPACPKCGHRKLAKQMSRFSPISGSKPDTGGAAGMGQGGEDGGDPGAGPGAGMPDLDDPRVERLMNEVERDMQHLDENNPRHIAHLLRKMKEVMPREFASKDMETALRRLEAGEDPEKIEEDMGDVLDSLMPGGPSGKSGGEYSRDPGLYDL